jgi:uncharacterized membrane protein
MPPSWNSSLTRWTEAGLIDSHTADRIRAWEDHRGGGRRWPVWLALGLGGLMLGAGVLLFVAAHWDALGPGERFALVLAAVAGFHVAGAFATDRFEGLAVTLHTCGTLALGGGIYLAGQIFHLEEHWPGGLLLWAVGAWAGFALRRDWTQLLLGALLTPAWLSGEWLVAAGDRRGAAPLAAGLVGLALAYLGAEPSSAPPGSHARRGLVWIGALGLIPGTLFLIVTAIVTATSRSFTDSPPTMQALLGWGGAVALPLATAFLLRPASLAPVAAGVVWAALGAAFAVREHGVTPYLWSAVLALGLIGWGLKDRRELLVNLGIAGFALTVTIYYFSDVMDRLGRSASLIGMGLLFLGGGYLLHRTRRGLLARLQESP